MPPLDIDDNEETDLLKNPAETALFSARRQAHVVFTDRAGRHDILVDRRLVVGSGAGVDVVIDDPAVSRLHAEIDPRLSGVWITDLGSKNGTTVEGLRLGSICVRDGTRVRLGNVEVTIAFGPASSSTPAPTELKFGPLIGESPAMRALYGSLARIAPTDATVLIFGETGTGKELVAHAIHDASPRREEPYVIVDCGALSEDLLESELFGHAKGAFTGAVASRAGAFESADGGTVFLDEIGELPLSMQPKLLRAIESRTVRRLGENASRQVDVRIVAATHRDLRMMVNDGTFREDLYFRLAVVPLDLPPLRDRLSDIPPLVQHFLAQRGGGSASAEVLQELAQRSWLGNVRELRNFVDRVLALGADAALKLPVSPTRTSSIPVAPTEPGLTVSLPSPPLDVPFKVIREQWTDHLEREYLRGLLAKFQGNIAAVAYAAGLDRGYVYRVLRKHDIEVSRPATKGNRNQP